MQVNIDGWIVETKNIQAISPVRNFYKNGDGLFGFIIVLQDKKDIEIYRFRDQVKNVELAREALIAMWEKDISQIPQITI